MAHQSCDASQTKRAELNMLLLRQGIISCSLVTYAHASTAGAAELNDPEQTLEALGLDNRAMLVMRWAAG